MERVFTEDILKDDGSVRFGAGEVRDFPRDTWEGLARTLGCSLKDFTDTVTDFARKVVQSTREEFKGRRYAEGKKKSKSSQPKRVRL